MQESIELAQKYAREKIVDGTKLYKIMIPSIIRIFVENENEGFSVKRLCAEMVSEAQANASTPEKMLVNLFVDAMDQYDKPQHLR